ncbi:MAG: DUF2149 domain-containing protein [Clostridiales Family XIII bacterium]|jgi:hypothetical protein|nr:DUF2149 domain-containing protein [Clostridiales Family XIII bacterium]
MQRNRLRQKNKFFDEADEVNPMEGAVNIVDAMLVFACGLMLSLVIFWNVDLRNEDMKPVGIGEDASELAEELQNSMNEENPDSAQYEEVGKVYRDPATGKLYLAED